MQGAQVQGCIPALRRQPMAIRLAVVVVGSFSVYWMSAFHMGKTKDKALCREIVGRLEEQKEVHGFGTEWMRGENWYCRQKGR